MPHRGPEGPSRLAHPQTELVENILGVPLLLPNPDTEIKEGRMAASTAAYFFALEMVQHHTGLTIPADTTKKVKLPDTDLRELSVLPDVAFLSREVRIANNIAANTLRPLTLPENADKPDTPRSRLQSTLIGRIAAHYQTLPTGLQYEPDSPLGVRLRDGFALIAKTGIGKTILAALMMRLAGLTDDPEPGQKPLEGTVATSSLKLVKQFAGESGNNTFRRFLGEDVPVTKVTGKHFDTSGRIRITTTRSIFKFDPGNLLTVDEGHRALGKELAQYLGESSVRPLLLTATPAYDQRRDIRKLWSSFESPSTRTLIEDGILNPTRLLTFEYDDDPVPMVAATALAYMRTGRKAGIYCKAGSESAQARRIADLINKKAGERLIEAVGSHQPKSDGFEQEFDDGVLRGLSTCQRLGEGWDATDADVGMFIDPGAAWQLEQNSGRFMRPGKFVTELCEFFRRGVARKTSLWKIMDLEAADPSKIIGYKEPAEDDEGQKSPSPGTAAPKPDVLPLEDLPPIALDNLLVGAPLRRVLLGREEEAPSEGFTRKLQTLADTHNVPVKWLQSKLDQQGFRYEGIREFDSETEETTYDRWYEGDAVDAWIAKNPLPELASTDEITAKSMAGILETTLYHITEILNELRLKPSPRLTKGSHQKRPHYDFETFCRVSEKVEKDTPLAEETDVVVGALYEECSPEFVARCINKISYTENRTLLFSKRRNPVHGMKGIAMHISLTDAEAIRAERKVYDAIPIADPEIHTPITGAAKRTGLSLQIFEKRLLEEEAAAIILLRKSQKARPGRFIPNDILAGVVERLALRKLDAHLVPVRIYREHFSVGKEKRAVEWLTEKFGEPEEYRLEGGIRDTPCITWDQLRAGEKEFGKRPSALEIDYTKLVQGPDDTDPDRWHYTQTVQRHYLGDIPSHPLAPLPEHVPTPEPEPAITPKVEVSESEPAVLAAPPDEQKTEEEVVELPKPDVKHEEEKPADNVTETEQPKILNDTERRAAVAAARGNRPTSRQRFQPERAAPKPQPKTTTIPANFENIDEYLSSKCHPRILNALIKSKKIAVRKDENNARWASDDDVLQLEEAIQRYPVAKPTMVTGEQIVDEIVKDFPGLPLKPEHVFFVASKVVGSTAGHVELCRALQADGTPGMLNHFYHAPIQAMIKERLAFIFNSTTRTRSLLRFDNI